MCMTYAGRRRYSSGEPDHQFLNQRADVGHCRVREIAPELRCRKRRVAPCAVGGELVEAIRHDGTELRQGAAEAEVQRGELARRKGVRLDRLRQQVHANRRLHLAGVPGQATVGMHVAPFRLVLHQVDRAGTDEGGIDRLLNVDQRDPERGDVAAVTVDEQEALEAVRVQAADDLQQHPAERRGAE